MAKRAPARTRKQTTPPTPPDTTDDRAETLADAAIGSTEPQVTEEDIRERAYHRYLQRGGGHGMDFEDWLEAERELRLKK
ncbi:MAG TPA: DUF2934 domain-containing protein [Vicinamibacterales bacterium]|nr:DUF2934 domain-containing protein [Vicinamibacterales bacterium]